MALSKALQKFAELAKRDDGFWVEKAKLDFSQVLENHRRIAGLTYAAIAEKIGTSAAYISKVFRGDANLTIESMVKLAHATGGRLQIEIVPEQVNSQRWAHTLITNRRDAANHTHIRTERSVVPLRSCGANQDQEQRAA